MPKNNTLIPAVIVILALCAFIGMYFMSIWPDDSVFNYQPSVIHRTKKAVPTSTTSNTNSVSTTNANHR